MSSFKISNDTMVVTSTYITRDGFPILEVSHEDDEDRGSLWQFHAGNGDYGMDRMQLVRLGTILALDFSITELGDLGMGLTARRSASGESWTIS